MLGFVQVLLLEQSVQGGEMVAHIVAVDAPQLHLLAKGVVVPALKLHLAGVFIHLHLPPQGEQAGHVGQGHEEHHQKGGANP